MLVRKIVTSVVAGVACLVVSGVGAPGAWAATYGVSMVDFSFSPATLTVQAGDTVVWTNTDAAPHTVTADGGSFDSGSVAPGGTYSHTFSSAGVLAYHCGFHGASGGVGMSGQVTVEAAATTTTSTGPVATTAPGTPTSAGSDTVAVSPTSAGPQLARTGSSTSTLAVIAVALVAAGYLALLASRRRAVDDTRG